MSLKIKTVTFAEQYCTICGTLKMAVKTVVFLNKITNGRLKCFVILAKWFQNGIIYVQGKQRQIIPKWRADVSKIDGLAQC